MGGSVRDAVESADAILIAIPWNRLDDAVAQSPSFRGRVLLDCSQPMTESGSDLAVAWHNSGAEQLASVTEGRVVKEFNTIPAEFIAAERRARASSLSGPDLHSRTHRWNSTCGASSESLTSG
jgi:predicted dinucleotide-binding enzyme